MFNIKINNNRNFFLIYKNKELFILFIVLNIKQIYAPYKGLSITISNFVKFVIFSCSKVLPLYVNSFEPR